MPEMNHARDDRRPSKGKNACESDSATETDTDAEMEVDERVRNITQSVKRSESEVPYIFR